MKTTTDDKTLSTADFAAAADRRDAQSDRRDPQSDGRDTQSDRRDPQSDRRDPQREARRDVQEAAGDVRETRDIRETREMGGSTPTELQSREARSAVAGHQDEQLAPLFLPQVAEQFRLRWDEVQIGFVDDPTQAVRKADELVAQVMKNLAETFSTERANFEGQLDQTDTEHMRVALRRYRSFFQRLLSL